MLANRLASFEELHSFGLFFVRTLMKYGILEGVEERGAHCSVGSTPMLDFRWLAGQETVHGVGAEIPLLWKPGKFLHS